MVKLTIMIAALLIDMDGTLIDSEPLHFRAHEQFLATVGIQVTEADLVGNIGKGDQTFYAELARRAGVPCDPAEWVRGKTTMLMQIYREGGLALRPGAKALLDAAIHAAIPRILVTNSAGAVATLALHAAGIAHQLTGRVCWEDTPAHKPDPMPYQVAAARLALPPSACVAIEDSPSGVRAAVAAGCRTLAVVGLVPEAELRAAGAHRVAHSLTEISDLEALDCLLGHNSLLGQP